ncbi:MULTISPECIES: sensor protein KdpD [unclassified Mucilaginibacter]|uniref:sensor protein KdpD n=1 Tax=unclassified Mucilaginibacter TaxID=2617802 RepID=UPI002AC9B1D9|nr:MULTISPECIES: sensor protein KdpD [unclassified Mucilaginibacter]MEB0248805.1 sensor protein KdpD [Mucilaginibacter sp. 5B2]MEB0264066.1 sensor protein KdpD [Mucilaginibacter sp. 10I4]MEB0280885.1 sensor protein KdpD [Mucilaginibacter sp. 10B2]MEB0303161.1 sensor protein KdpD [Mucilaginibacter sp. 5C4]WPX23569.1 sensor protein KdpD [Mucilaginibacter sp. 5C4]
MAEKDTSVKNFLDLVKKSRRGKLKIYIGMSAGVGKSYRMLQEAHALQRNGIGIQIGYIETHNRAETHALLEGLPVIARRKTFYKGKELEEMDLQAIINRHPEVVIVDELAHSNIEGSKNSKRWQDVLDILEAGISVITAVNIQHLESLNEDVEQITGIAITERIPDKILDLADEVVNIDLTADELVDRLKEGKIYEKAKIERALQNFFQSDKILQLRELALKEVAHHVERKIDTEIPKQIKLRPEKFLACISSNAETAKIVIRKTARLASYYRSPWIVLYVQSSSESLDRIKLDKQRHLINNFKLATELGAELIKLKSDAITQTIMKVAEEKEVTTICIGKPHLNLWQVILRTAIFNELLNKIALTETDLVILS